jgi:ribonuclease VapC
VIVDSSAVLALLLDEEPAEAIQRALGTGNPIIPAVVIVESSLRLSRLPNRQAQLNSLQAMPSRIGARIEPFLPQDAPVAVAAFQRFGKGQGHPAQLNFGDCLVYAIARRLDGPLLCLGQDFAATDLSLVPLALD